MQEITLLEGLGVKGDAHAGVKVQHLYDIKCRDPDAANLRQVRVAPQLRTCLCCNC